MSRGKSRLGAIYAGGLAETSTAFAGAGLLIELFRQAGVQAVAEKALPAKRSSRGLSHGQMVESFVLLSALGGESLEDMERLRGDQGLPAVLGYMPPAPETARQWLDRFHDEAAMAGRPEQGSFLPPETSGLAGLRATNQRVVAAYVAAVQPAEDVTLDVDAHLVESAKADAKRCYEGYPAYQPMEVVWAETGLVLADEFREGNVPASKDIRRMVDEAYAALPSKTWKVRVRSDSAAYEPEGVLDHWHGLGWEFAVSADLSQQLRKAIAALPEASWHTWKRESGGMLREWAEVPYVPSRTHDKLSDPIYRYVAIRVRPHQGVLLEDPGAQRHFAVVTNRWDVAGEALLEWHRGKAGTIEHIHHILVSELGAGVYPSGKHGANAAWLRLQVLTHNLLQVLKAVALPPEYRRAYPKRLRFAIFTQVGQVVRHAGSLLLRVVDRIWEILGPGQRDLVAASWSGG